MRRGLKEQGRTRQEYDGDHEVLFDRRVFEYMVEELSRNLSVEDGGKYVGYYLKAGDPQLERFGLGSKNAIVVVDFLPSGPNAVRTAVELMPDGPYQEALFRQIERLDPRIEHVGTWHSHHCNGLERLSPGDIKGYFKTVNKPAYNLDCYVTSLVKRVPQRVDALAWIDHFLFLRGAREYYQITNRIRVIDWPSAFGDLTGHGTQDQGVRPAITPGAALSEGGELKPPAAWFDTGEGRSVLAADKRFFDESFGSVTATRRDSQITIAGRLGQRTVAVTYPRDAGDQRVSIVVRHEDSVVMRIDCTLSHRKLAYKATLAAVEDS